MPTNTQQMKEVIQRAIEGGYGIEETYTRENKEFLNRATLQTHWKVLTADPLFWQALRKVEKWGYYDNESGKPMWQYQWHRFIDHLAEGKPTEDFFTKLLKSN